MIGPRTRRVRCSGESASRPRTGVRPVLLDDLHGELPRGEEVRRGAVAGGALEAEVEESEDALGEGEGGVGVRVEEQRRILGGGAEEVSSARGVGARSGRHLGAGDDLVADFPVRRRAGRAVLVAH